MFTKVLIGVLMTMVMVGSASAQVLVVRSQGPSAGAYPAGSVLSLNTQIRLVPGDVLQIMDSGGSRTLNGPLIQFAGAVAGRSTSVLAELAAREHSRRPNLGAARGEPPQAPVNNIWLIDVTAETACVAPGEPSGLLRQNAARDQEIEILPQGAAAGAAPLRTVWPAGSAELAWPDFLPRPDGARYLIRLDGRYATSLTWRTVPPLDQGLDAFGQALLARGCDDQFDVVAAFAAR